jgi:hypothetical protein
MAGRTRSTEREIAEDGRGWRQGAIGTLDQAEQQPREVVHFKHKNKRLLVGHGRD